jgi:hypothetical protein
LLGMQEGRMKKLSISFVCSQHMHDKISSPELNQIF